MNTLQRRNLLQLNFILVIIILQMNTSQLMTSQESSFITHLKIWSWRVLLENSSYEPRDGHVTNVRVRILNRIENANQSQHFVSLKVLNFVSNFFVKRKFSCKTVRKQILDIKLRKLVQSAFAKNVKRFISKCMYRESKQKFPHFVFK